MVLFKLYISYYISLKPNLKNKISGNKVENEIFGDIKIELIDNKKDWVKEIMALPIQNT